MTLRTEPSRGIRGRRFAVGEALIGTMPMLRRYARSLCGDPVMAEDLVQETFTRALDHADSFRPGTNLEAWLTTILHNHFRSEGRKRRREVEDVDDLLAGRLSEPARQEDRVLLDEFESALAEIPDEQRDALLLVGAVGHSYERAAEICDVRTGTIKSRVSRARARLHELLDA